MISSKILNWLASHSPDLFSSGLKDLVQWDLLHEFTEKYTRIIQGSSKNPLVCSLNTVGEISADLADLNIFALSGYNFINSLLFD